ncbi:hypothetical protein [Rhizobium esperanzae]|uniref:hypothetical protein n=1 Tax=Rhizobium esperanzae TaxID=1967781 RepID=UPI00113169BD|nr:hypothetical protein [Rhizobium esperanzae]
MGFVQAEVAFRPSFRPYVATTFDRFPPALHCRHGQIYALLIVAVDIAIIVLAGRWNTSDADHYLGFRNLRSRRKRQASSPQLRVSACRP